MNMIWQQFVESPGLQTYQKLRANAMVVKTSRDKLRLVESDEHGVNASGSTKISHAGRRTRITQDVADEDNAEWFSWRENALRHLRERSGFPKEADIRSSSSQAKTNTLANETIRVSNPWEPQPDHSLLVEIFLWEKRHEEAWHEAIADGCAEHLWRQLADAIAKVHPDKAFRVYQELIAPTIAPTNNMAYGEAMKLLKKMHKLASRLDREREFDDYLIALRAQYKPKRNFIKLLDGIRACEDQ